MKSLFNRASQAPYLLLTLTMLMWSANAVAARIAVDEVSPLMLTAIRWVGVTSLVFALAHKRIISEWPILRPRLPLLLGLGALGFSTFNAMFYWAAHSTSAINIGIIQGAVPVLVMLGAYMMYKTQVSGTQAIGVTITIIGVVVVAVRGDFERISEVQFNPGDLLMITACMLYAVYTVALRQRPAASGVAIFSVMAVGALATSIPMAVVEVALGHSLWPTQTGWAVIAFVVIFPSLLAQLFFIRGVELLGPGRAGVFINLVPVITAILGVYILGELFRGYHAAALLLVLGGIWLAERKQNRAAVP